MDSHGSPWLVLLLRLWRLCRLGGADDGGTRERFLSEFSRRGRDRRKLQYAVLAAAAVHGGAGPDLLDEVAWWQAGDFWQYALFAAVLSIRAAAGRAGVPVAQACREMGGGAGRQPG